MAKQPTRLRFTEDDLSDARVKKAADRAEKAADKAEKAVDKVIPKKSSKLRQETSAAGSRKAKLRFDKAKTDEVITERPSRAKQLATRAPVAAVSSKAHQAVSEYEDDNVGVQSVEESVKAVETTAYTVNHAVYSHKLKAHDKADKLVHKSDQANVDALYEKFKKDNPDASSNPFSRWQQKHNIKKEYAAAKAGKNTANTTATATKGTEKVAQKAKDAANKVREFVTSHSKILLVVLAAALLFMVIAGMFSSCGAMFQGGTQIVLGTSYTADDEEITGANDDYSALEAALRNKINNIERTHSGYDEYRYDLDEINHKTITKRAPFLAGRTCGIIGC